MILSFMGLALVLERCLPGKVEYGPETATGHVPSYVANGVSHCIAFSFLFFLGSDLGPCGGGGGGWWWWSWADRPGLCGVVRYEPYSFGVLYDLFPPGLAFLNLFGIFFCIFLTYKGVYHPSTSDNGSSGSYVKDYLWGTELYPRVFGLDLKRFVNCRFSMTFWQLAGLSYCYRSYVLHGHTMDWGLFFSALSQYLYLVKFFVWVSWVLVFFFAVFSFFLVGIAPRRVLWVRSSPRGTPSRPPDVIIFALTIYSPHRSGVVRFQEMGYMRSIDIIVDRAGYEIQWGCLVWVPAVYSFHTRFLVQNPSGLSFHAALSLFALSMAGVGLNYAADRERDVFRASGGDCLVWGSRPRYIVAEYTVVDGNTGKGTTKTSLLLASGFWGLARHFQYFFELTAAYSWCLLANPARNGILVMFYALFLTLLLVDRAKRDTDKCRLKYGKYYDEYCDLVPYKIVPGIF
jgi:7-dehydrocholesterol reductase